MFPRRGGTRITVSNEIQFRRGRQSTIDSV